MTTPLHGTLWEDAVWRGRVWIDGDVIVPKGRTLTILPSSLLQFLDKNPLDYRVHRPDQDGIRPLMRPRRPHLIVYGTLRALSKSAGERIRFGADSPQPWGGIVALNGSRIVLRGATLESYATALTCADFAGAELEDCRFSGGSAGILGLGFSRIRCKESFWENNDDAVELQGDARLDLEGCRMEGGKTGLRLTQNSLSRALSCEIRGQSQEGIRCSERARLELSGGLVQGNGVGLRASGSSRIAAERIDFKENAHCGLFLFESAVFSGRAANLLSHAQGEGALVRDDARLSLADGQVSRNRVGIAHQSRGPLAVEGTEARANQWAAIKIEAGAATLRGNRILENAWGIDCGPDASADCIENRIERQSETGILARGQAKLRLDGNTLEACARGVQGEDRSLISMSADRIFRSSAQSIWVRQNCALSLRGVTVAEAGGPALHSESRAALDVRDSVFQTSREGIRVQGAGPLRIWRSDISKNRYDGITLDAGSLSLRDCSVLENENGLRLATGVRAELKRARVRLNRRHGVAVHERPPDPGAAEPTSEAGTGTLRFQGSDISQNQGDGIAAAAGSLSLRDCSVLENENGVRVAAGVHAEIERARVRLNRKQGIFVAIKLHDLGPAEPVPQARIGTFRVRRSDISGNQGDGIAAGAGSLSLRECSVLENENGVRVAAGVPAEIERVRVRLNRKQGLSISEDLPDLDIGGPAPQGGAARVRVRRCEVAQNRGDGIAAAAGSLTLRDCAAFENENGISASRDARVEIERLRVRLNRGKGIWLSGRSNVRARKVRIEENAALAVECTEAAQLRLSDCEVRRHPDGLILRDGLLECGDCLISEQRSIVLNVFSGTARLAGCRIEGGNFGVICGADSRVSLEACSVSKVAETGLQGSDRAELSVSACRLEASRVGIRAQGECRLRVSDSRMRRCFIGLESLDRSATASLRNRLSENRLGCYVGPDARVEEASNRHAENIEDRLFLNSPSPA